MAFQTGRIVVALPYIPKEKGLTRVSVDVFWRKDEISVGLSVWAAFLLSFCLAAWT